MSLSFGAIASQSSSAACKVGAMAEASVQRQIARDDHEPAVAAALQGSEFTAASFPVGDGERSEPGEGLDTLESPLTRPALAALRRVDLSPQAGRGEEETGSEFHGSRLPGLKFFFNPLQQSM